MTKLAFANVPENRVSDAKNVESLIRKYLSAVKKFDEAALRSTFESSANISHYYVKGDTVRVNDVDGFVDVIRSLHTPVHPPASFKIRRISVQSR